MRFALVPLICSITACAGISPFGRLYQAEPVPHPVPTSKCDSSPDGLRLYGGIALSEIEQAGEFDMEEPERGTLVTSRPIWVEFRSGLEPTDVIYEYALSDAWEEGGRFYTVHAGGLIAFRAGCAVKKTRVWMT